MILNISEILDFLNECHYEYSYFGDHELFINDFCSLNSLKKNSITWIKKYEKYDIHKINQSLSLLLITDNSLINEEDIRGYNLVTCENPKEIFFNILSRYFKAEKETKIEPTSIILSDKIGINVSIGHNCFIGRDVIIADNVVIRNNVVIECRASIGKNTIVNSGVIIGTDGFGYYRSNDGTIHNVPHFGGVSIGENVDIGANTCIDRGTIDDTVIEDNVKVDNLCHIAHNVHIQKNSFVIALSMLGGSSKLEKNSYIAPGSLVMNQITIGENSIVGMGAVVTKDVEENKVVVGVPAKVIRDNT